MSNSSLVVRNDAREDEHGKKSAKVCLDINRPSHGKELGGGACLAASYQLVKRPSRITLARHSISQLTFRNGNRNRSSHSTPSHSKIHAIMNYRGLACAAIGRIGNA
jgi:hypothetical protein